MEHVLVDRLMQFLTIDIQDAKVQYYSDVSYDDYVILFFEISNYLFTYSVSKEAISFSHCVSTIRCYRGDQW